MLTAFIFIYSDITCPCLVPNVFLISVLFFVFFNVIFNLNCLFIYFVCVMHLQLALPISLYRWLYNDNKVYLSLSYINAKILWSCITILLCCPIFSPKAGTGTIREMPNLRPQRSRARLAPGEDICEKCRFSNSSDYLSSNEHQLVGRGVCCRYHASLPRRTPPLQGRTSWRRRIESQNQTLCFRRRASHIFTLGRTH